MIIEIALVSAGAAALGAWLAGRRRTTEARETASPGAKAAEPDGWDFVRLGDVLATGSEERWLTGVVRALDGREQALAVFLATDAPLGRAVGVHAETPDLLWLERAPVPAEVPRAGAFPTTLEVDRTVFRSTARLPVRFSVEGEFERRAPTEAPDGAPGEPRIEPFDPGDGDFALYGSGVRDVLLVLRGPSGEPWAWRGRCVPRGDIERWGKGAS